MERGVVRLRERKSAMLVWARPGGFLGGVRESAKGERASEGRKEVRREKGGPKGEGRSYAME